MQNFRGKKRPTNSIINLKLFTDSFSNPNPTKSPRKFQNVVVGLGIVAAMTDHNSTTHQQPICFAPSPRSTTTPIPIKPNFDEFSNKVNSVISLFGGDGDDDNKNCSVLNMGQFKEFWCDDFLTNCHLCKKELHGLDIFMYRGEKAFCSAECRDKQITSDDHKQTAKKGKPLDCSEPALSCSGPQVLFAVVSAA